MAVQVTAEQVNQQLSALGYEAPAFIIDAYLCKVNAIDACLDGAGYDDCDQLLIKVYAVVLMLASSDVRKVVSQSGPSGASRSFKYFDDGRASLRSALMMLDSAGCTASLPIDSGGGVVQFCVVRG
ncbi:hypothetical protein [Pragia fontium]|uniref:DUF7370 family protein n=1 Tax=Pragia fontium TaxID=82985 RepID=UPI00064B1383|nr:hypothetical protein [Pragia fontium]AKJ41794.1 hypothetical protein QQ39_06615 [Pragia fontium]